MDAICEFEGWKELNLCAILKGIEFKRIEDD